MDIEQLKLILETVGAAGEGAFWIAMFYIGAEYIFAIGWTLVPIVLIFKGAGLIRKSLENDRDKQ